MIETRKEDAELPEEQDAIAGGDGDDGQDNESLSVSERRARRRARRDTSDDDEDGGGTESKAVSTRKQREALKERERDNLKRSDRLPLVGGLVRYFRGVAAEIQKVTWPTREEARRLTIIVIAVTIVFAIMLGIIDLFYGWWFRLGVESTSGFLIAAVPFFLIAGGLSYLLIFREPDDEDIFSAARKRNN